MNNIWSETNVLNDRPDWYVCVVSKTYRIVFINNWKKQDFIDVLRFTQKYYAFKTSFSLN